MYQGQLLQIEVGLISLIIFLYFRTLLPTTSEKFLGLTASYWYGIAVFLPILHQVVIAPLWRSELLHQGLTRIFGTTEKAFLFFKIVFALFFVPRLFIAIPLAILTRNTLPSPLILPAFVFAGIMTPLLIYGFYSVKEYFGVTRAFGADHFFESYRQLPKVKEGLFKYMDNAMYAIVLGITWVPAMYLLSAPGIIVGVFNHLFVWVHYFFIEKPDMKYIYES